MLVVRAGQPLSVGALIPGRFASAAHITTAAPAAIVVAMAAAGQPHPIPAIPPLPEGAGPRAIRAALIAEERAEFD